MFAQTAQHLSHPPRKNAHRQTLFLRHPQTLQAQLQRGQGLRIGYDYIPALTCELAIKAPFQPESHLHMALTAHGLTTTQVPTAFSWTNPSQVRQYRLSNFSPGWLMAIPNQAQCGSCWAVSSASMLTDRYSIATQTKIPVLSAIAGGACATNQQGADICQGGFPSDLGCYAEQIGLVPDTCWPYSEFCPPSGSTSCTSTEGKYQCCAGGGLQSKSTYLSVDDDKGTPVNCQDFASRTGTQCGVAPGNPSACASNAKANPTHYKAEKGTTASLADGSYTEVQKRMQLNIMSGGPVVGAFSVYADFMLPALPQWGWKATNGIYIHANPSPYIQDPWLTQLFAQRTQRSADVNVVSNLTGVDATTYTDLESFKSAVNAGLQALKGGHAVTIMGWASGQANPKYGNVNYWIVRNSWGNQWNEQGFFRLAWSSDDDAKALNRLVSLEKWISADGQILGGATTWSVPTHLIRKGTKGSSPWLSLTTTTHPWLIGVIVLCIVVLGYYLYRQRQRLG